MKASVLENGNLLVPMRAESDGLVGDALVEISSSHPQFAIWMAYLQSEAKANPNHDEHGRFAEGDGSGGGSDTPSAKAHDWMQLWSYGKEDKPSDQMPADPSDEVIQELGKYLPEGKVTVFRGHRYGFQRNEMESWTTERGLAQAIVDDNLENGLDSTVLKSTITKNDVLSYNPMLPKSYDVVDSEVIVVRGSMRKRMMAIRSKKDYYRFKENPNHDPETGQFAEGGGSGGGGGRVSRRAGLVSAADRNEMPQHIQDLKPPPAWTDVRYAEDPNADLLVVGKDAKGKDQYIYSERFVAQKANEKFGRIRSLSEKEPAISRQLASDMRSQDPKVRENAVATELIHQTGIRPGGEIDNAEVKAYGATTLRGEHVIVEGSRVRLVFTGKKGVAQDVPVSDPTLVRELADRKAAVGDTGKIFNTDGESLRAYAGGLDGGGYHPKDFRTLLGTTTAASLVDSMPVPKTESEYKRAVKNVATQVSAKLGNTPTVALQSYISPTVFSKWR